MKWREAASIALSALLGFAGGFALTGMAGHRTPCKEILETWKKIKIRIYGESGIYERSPGNLSDRYVHLFYVMPTLDMALLGVEDLDPGRNPDGWTDVLLPTFYSIAPNRGNVTDRPIIFIDTAMSGGYTKELLIYTQGKWVRLLHYSVEKGMRFYGPDGPMTSVGYIEYDPLLDKVYHPVGI